MGRVLITGVTGGLGHALSKALIDRRYRIVGIAKHRPPDGTDPLEEFIAADIAEIDWDRALRGCETVFHLAGYVHRSIATESDRVVAWRTNVDATARLASACRRHRIRLVFASSVAALQYSTSESGQKNASEYARTKWWAEHQVRAEADRGLEFVILRFPLLYGPGGRGNMERLMRAIHRRRYWPFGAGSAKKSCLFFGDAAQAMVRASQAAGALCGTYVVAPPVPATLEQIHRHAFAAFGRRSPPPLPLPVVTAATRIVDAVSPYLIGRPTSLTASAKTLASDAAFDGSAFAKACGFKPAVALAEGLKTTADWIRGIHA